MYCTYVGLEGVTFFIKKIGCVAVALLDFSRPDQTMKMAAPNRNHVL